MDYEAILALLASLVRQTMALTQRVAELEAQAGQDMVTKMPPREGRSGE